MTFISWNSDKVPASRCNSCANVTWSPAKAAALAFSKLIFLPINNSASSSLDIELSKSNNDFPADATSSRDEPNNLA